MVYHTSDEYSLNPSAGNQTNNNTTNSQQNSNSQNNQRGRGSGYGRGRGAIYVDSDNHRIVGNDSNSNSNL